MTGLIHSAIEKINDCVYYAYLSIPAFIERSMKGYIPRDYRTAGSVDFTANGNVLRYCTASELERIAGARVLKRQIEWLCGRVVLKDLILSVMFPGYDYPDLVIGYDASGRPCIRDYESTGISVTHSGEVAMAALCTIPGKKVGIDVEKTTGIDINSVLSVAFTPEERELYKDQNAVNIISAFTMKEAYLKITGQGFHEVVTRISVRNNKIFFDNREVTGLEITNMSYGEEYVVSIINEA